MLEDIRVRARDLLDVMADIEGVAKMFDRAGYINAVRAYAVEKHGATDDVRMHAERTARHLWATRGSDG